MMCLKNIITLLILFTVSLPCLAQEKKVGMADMMRANGRIYVVVAVVLTILAGLIIYLIRLDKKISKLEKD